MIEKTLVPITEGKQHSFNSGRLYYLADINPPKDIHNAFFFNIDKVSNTLIQDLTYEPYYEDFGPLNIARVWKYIN
jgi:hypothetical protein